MALEASTLTVRVVSDGITDATKALNDLAKAGEAAEKKTSNIGSGAKTSAKAQVDAAQQAASAYNAIIDMMTEKSNEFYANKAMKAALASQQEIFDGMALADKIMAIVQQSQSDRAAMREKESADIRAKQQEQMQAAQVWYAQQQELANKMNAIYDKKQESKLGRDQEAAILEDKRRAWKALGEAQAEALKINAQIDAANKKLENDHTAAILEDKKRAWKALGQAQSEAMAMNAKMDRDAQNLRADADEFVKALKRQADTVGMTTKELREYNAEQLRTKAAQLGVTDQVDGFINKLKQSKGPHESFNFLTAGSAREMMVLGHELSQGQFNRFYGSLIVLAERINFLPSLLEKAGAAAGAMGVSMGVLVSGVIAAAVAIGASIYTYEKSRIALKEMNDQAILTGHSFGVSGEALYEMSNKIGAVNGNLSETRETIVKLASTGKFSAEQIGMITEAAVGLQKYGGVAIETTIKQFEKLAAEPLKAGMRGFKGISDAAVELNQQLGFLEPAVLAEVIHLERIGDTAGASAKIIKALAEEEKNRIQELKGELTVFGSVLDTITTKAKAMWNSLWNKGTLQDQLAEVTEHIVTLSKKIGAGGMLANNGVLQNELNGYLAKSNELQDKISAKEKSEADKKHKRDVDNAADLAEIEIRNILEKGKYETRFQEDKARLDKSFAALRAAGITTGIGGQDTYDRALANLKKADTPKEPKPKSDGLAGVTDAISKIQDEYDIQKNLIDNQIKQVDAANQKKIMSDAAASAAKAKLLDQEDKLALATLEKEMKVREAFYSADKRLMEQNDKAKNDLQKRLTIARQNAESKGVINAMDDFDPKAQAAADTASQKIVEETVKQTEAIRAKVDAYNNLPEAVRKSVTNEKQMADAVTQALIESKQARIDFLSSGFNEGGQSDKEIQRLTSEVNAMRDRVKAEKDLEDVQKRIAGVAGRSSSLTRVATEQVKMWKDTGNEIERALTSAFGNAGNAAGKMVKAFSEGAASQVEIADKIRQVKEKDGLTEQERINQTAALQNQATQTQIGMYGNMAGAAAGFFDKQSKGYQVATAVSRAFHLAETAMAIASIPAKLAAGKATMFAQSGWGAFAGIAAMMAVMGQFASGGGGGSMSDNQQKIQGSGTVLGSPTIVDGTTVKLAGAKSDSIANSLKELEKTSGLGLVVQNDMLKAMTSLNNNITALAKSIATNGSLSGLTASPYLTGIASSVSGTVGKVLGGTIGGLAGKVATSVFGGKVSVDDTGLQVNSATLAQIAANGISANQYTNTTKSGGLFSSDKHKTTLAALDATTTDQFTQAILSMEDAIKQAGVSLGVSGDDFNQKLNSFVVDIGKVSLKGMTSDQIQTTLQNVFSKLGDQMSSYMFADLAKYQKVGEGLLQTVSRVADDLMQVNDVFKVLGRTMPQAAAGIAQAEKLVDSFGSSDALTKAVKSYEDVIYTDNEKLAPVVKSVQDSLKSLGLSSVKTKADFKLVVDSLDLTSDAGVSLFNKMMAIAPTFGTAMDGLSKVNQTAKDSMQSVIDKLKQFSDNIKKFRDGLVLGANSPFTPAQKLADAASQFQNTVKKAMSGDSTAQGNVTDVAQSYLDAARTMFASGDAYTDVFNKVQAELAKVEDFADAGVSDTQKQLDAMNDQLTSLNTLNGTASDILNSLNSLVNGTSPATTSTSNASTNAELLQVLNTLVGTIQESDANNANGLNNVASATYDGQYAAAERISDGIATAVTLLKKSGALYKVVER